MRIEAQPDDAPEFIAQVEAAVNGAARLYSPAKLILIKMDNWFGSKWLGYSGNPIPHVAAWHKPMYEPFEELPDALRIPPFVPGKVVSQRRFAAPGYVEMDAGELVHRQIRSRDALRRRIGEEFPGTAFFWYGGNSNENRRGALMAYLPMERAHWPWYVGFQRSASWMVRETWDIKQDDFFRLATLEPATPTPA